MADEVETAEKNHNGQSVNWTWTVHEMDNNYNVNIPEFDDYTCDYIRELPSSYS